VSSAKWPENDEKKQRKYGPNVTVIVTVVRPYES